MEQLLTLYLYQYKICPLPSVGTLVLQPGKAIALQAERLMQAPVSSIEFSATEANEDGLLQYISTALKIDSTAAALTLNHFCKSILKLDSGSEIKFANAGTFKVDDNHQLFFETAQPNAAFLPDVTAERIIHPNAKHNMLVGDTHTNTGTMTEVLSTEEKSRPFSWIWWATGLAVAATIVIVFYFYNNSSVGFGNANSTTPAKEPTSTYSTSTK